MSITINELYRKYLHGSLSKKELDAFKQEVKITSDYDLWQMMTEEAAAFEDTRQMPDEDKEKLLRFVFRKIKRSHKYQIFRYAAAVALLFVSVAVFYIYMQPRELPEAQMTRVVAPPGNKAHLVLPDGTEVSMNSGTELSYSVVPNRHRRVVINSGEVFFDVVKDSSCPFTVLVGDMEIEVLGTTFNVNTYNDKIETSLFTGSVKLRSPLLGHEYMLAPGEKSIYEKKSHRITVEPNDLFSDAGWKEGYLIFNSTPLREVFSGISCWYGVKIVLNRPDLADDLLTGSFHNETLESVLRSLGMQYGLKYEKQKGEIIVN